LNLSFGKAGKESQQQQSVAIGKEGSDGNSLDRNDD